VAWQDAGGSPLAIFRQKSDGEYKNADARYVKQTMFDGVGFQDELEIAMRRFACIFRY
jgi:hypothetical protein